MKRLALLSSLLSWIAQPALHAQVIGTLTVIYSFSGLDDGSLKSALVQGTDGSFYGTTQEGGSVNINGDPNIHGGSVFRVTSTGAFTTLYSFTGGSDGYEPEAALVQGTDGSFYGTTAGGGAYGDGTVFRVTSTGAFTSLHSFGGSDGADPQAALIQGSDGNFYGTTHSGGANGDGTVFRVTSTGAFATLYSFAGSDGQYPQAALTQGSDGNFYGTTYGGGTNDGGTVFRITSAGALTTLYSFAGRDGNGAAAALVQGSDGNFYGTTSYGGTNNFGTVFRITSAGALTTLHNFINSKSDGINPDAALIQGTDGNFYGTASDGGATFDGMIFQITPAGTLTIVHSFDFNDGSDPVTALVQARDGSFYGTTPNGGGRCGTIFNLVVSTPGTLQLSAATASVAESAGSVTLSVNRINGSNGAVSVNYATADSSAVSGVDYQPVSGTLSWADGDATSKTITVPIVDRKLTSGDAQFVVNLTQPVGNAALGTPTQEIVTILETDAVVDNITSVSLLSPPTNITLTQNEPVTLYADVEALANTLANVEFFVLDSSGNPTDLGGFTSERGQKTWQPPAAGNFTLEVIATDTQGNTESATNPVQIVAPGALGATPQTNLYGGLDGLTLALNDSVQVVAQAVDSNGNPLQNAQFYLDGVLVSTTPVDTSSAQIARAATAGPKAQDASVGSLFMANVTLSKAQQLLTAVGTTSAGVSAVSNAAKLYSKTGGSTPPSATISSVASGATLPAGSASQSVTVTANAGSQPIGSVELFLDSQSLGKLTAAPYSFALPALASGSHVLSAVATDQSLLSKVSAPVVVKAVQMAASQHIAFFTGEAALGNGAYYLSFPSGYYFGYYSYLSDPRYIYHYDLGYEFCFDAADNKDGVYFYDFASSTFFYTSPAFPFPYLYDFTLNTVLYYYPNPDQTDYPGHYNTDGYRFFYDFNTNSVIVK